MSPYRTPPEKPPRDVLDDASANDDRVLGVVLLLIGGVRVAIAFAHDEVLAGESTIALLMVACRRLADEEKLDQSVTDAALPAFVR